MWHHASNESRSEADLLNLSLFLTQKINETLACSNVVSKGDGTNYHLTKIFWYLPAYKFHIVSNSVIKTIKEYLSMLLFQLNDMLLLAAFSDLYVNYRLLNLWLGRMSYALLFWTFQIIIFLFISVAFFLCLQIKKLRVAISICCRSKFVTCCSFNLLIIFWVSKGDKLIFLTP